LVLPRLVEVAVKVLVQYLVRCLAVYPLNRRK
jgi:hypothetical protein